MERSSADKEREVLFREPSMHQPNDLAITRDQKIYFTDPDWSHASGRVWFAPQGRMPRVVADGLGTTNGIELSADDRFLYVNESTKRKLWRFEVKHDGTLVAKTLLLTFQEGQPRRQDSRVHPDRGSRAVESGVFRRAHLRDRAGSRLRRDPALIAIRT